MQEIIHSASILWNRKMEFTSLLIYSRNKPPIYPMTYTSQNHKKKNVDLWHEAILIDIETDFKIFCFQNSFHPWKHQCMGYIVSISSVKALVGFKNINLPACIYLRNKLFQKMSFLYTCVSFFKSVNLQSIIRSRGV